MKCIVPVVALAALAPAGAAAEDFHVNCVKGDEERAIEVVAPGEVGAACDVRYSPADGGEASVPYYADNSPDYCTARAADLARTLKNAGYQCAPVGADDMQARINDDPAAPALAGGEPTEPAPSPTPEPQPVETAGAQTVETAPASAELAQSEEASSASTDDAGDDALEERMRAILAEPAAPAAPEETQNAAVRGPARLTTGAEATPQNDAPASAVGRLVGAAPEEPPAEPQPATSPTPASLTTLEPEAAPAPAAEAPAKSGDPRKPEDVIRATLEAQAAAWNEGDLDAFMQTYWKSDELKFVSGTETTKGWSATMKRYRERYADESGLGWLAFDKLDVTMATNDVAVVTGRFNHAKGDAATSGAFTLVMHRQSGVWRIVHDHTTPDPKIEE